MISLYGFHITKFLGWAVTTSPKGVTIHPNFVYCFVDISCQRKLSCILSIHITEVEEFHISEIELNNARKDICYILCKNVETYIGFPSAN